MDASRVYLRVNRVAPALVLKALAVSVSDIHEAMGPRAREGLMSERMRPLIRGLRIAGPAVTAFCAPGDNLMMHRALYLAQAGDVLVVVSHDETGGAQWGDVAARYAKQKGLAGVIVQGCIRDTDALEEIRSPVWATSISPARPTKNGHGVVNAPVSCDGVIVYPGDMIVADGDGVVCVRRAEAEEVLEGAHARMAREQAVEKDIAAGAAPWDFTGASDSYRAMGITEIDAAWQP